MRGLHGGCMGTHTPCMHACTHPLHAKCECHAKPRMHTSAPGHQTLETYIPSHALAWAKNSGRGEEVALTPFDPRGVGWSTYEFW